MDEQLKPGFTFDELFSPVKDDIRQHAARVQHGCAQWIEALAKSTQVDETLNFTLGATLAFVELAALSLANYRNYLSFISKRDMDLNTFENLIDCLQREFATEAHQLIKEVDAEAKKDRAERGVKPPTEDKSPFSKSNLN